jgi:O-antigen ligase
MSAAVMIAMSVLDYLDIIEMLKITHVVETHGVDLFGREVKITRMCGTGMFHDPNDISLIVVVMSIICIYYLLEPTERLSRNTAIMFISKLIWLLPLAVFFTGLLCTQSRGGLLAMGAAIVAWSTVRYGKLPALAAIFLGIIAIPIMLGRQGDINLNEGTAQQRIRLWSDGLVAITNHRVLFGIGEGRYDEVAELVAHNSYIHSFVELGFLGGTFFFGCFFFAFYGLWKIESQKIPIYNPELHRFKAYFAGILAGYCIGMCSLSRCYIPPTYLICGIATCYFNLIGLYIWPTQSIVQWNGDGIKKLVTASACCLLCSFVMVKIFARF